MMLREVLHHVSYECERRNTECPQRCGNVLPLNQLKGNSTIIINGLWFTSFVDIIVNICFEYEGHLQFCPRRVLSCEPGMKCCERYLFKWFHRGISRGRQNTPLLLSNNNNQYDSDDEESQEKGERALKYIDDGEEEVMDGVVTVKQVYVLIIIICD